MEAAEPGPSIGLKSSTSGFFTGAFFEGGWLHLLAPSAG